MVLGTKFQKMQYTWTLLVRGFAGRPLESRGEALTIRAGAFGLWPGVGFKVEGFRD